MRINRLSLVMPALLIKISMFPKSTRTSSINFWASLKSAALDWYPFALTPKDDSSFSNSCAALAEAL